MDILITVAFMDGFHGAVMHARDMASFFKQRGDQVRIGTIFVAPNIKEMFSSMEVPVFELGKVPLEACYDIVFAYHYPTIGFLLKQGLRCNKLVLGSLSGEGRLETFPLYWDSASLLTVMSIKTAEKHHDKYGIPLEKMYVLENPIPDEYAVYELPRELPWSVPEKIAVVSNHVPQELKELPQYLPDSVQVTFYGKGSDNCQEMTPSLLGGYDVVITIGKTIQYAMGLGICAYEYDWHGGCGYITPDNMAAEAVRNFSGNLTQRKITAEAMAKELMAEYSSCHQQLGILKEMACRRFLLSDSLNRLLAKLDQAPAFNRESLKNSSYNEALELIQDECFVFWTKDLYKYRNERNSFMAKSRQNYEQLQECWKGRGKLWEAFQAKQKELAAVRAELAELKREVHMLRQEQQKVRGEKNEV